MKDGTSDNSIVYLNRFPKIVPVTSHRRKLGIIVVRFPNVNIPVLRPADYILSVVAKTGFDLTADVHVSFIFARQVQVAQIVQSNATVIRSDQDFIFSGHGFDASYFTTCCVTSPGGPDVDLCVVFKFFRGVENTTTIVRTDDRKFSILTEIGSGRQLRGAFQFVPYSNLREIWFFRKSNINLQIYFKVTVPYFFIWNIPKSNFSIE